MLALPNYICYRASMTNQSLPPLAQLLADLRHKSGLSLRQVEKASDVVSNVYLSQLELGRRSDPNPRFLVALAHVYNVPVKRLFEPQVMSTPRLQAPSMSHLNRS